LIRKGGLIRKCLSIGGWGFNGLIFRRRDARFLDIFEYQERCDDGWGRENHKHPPPILGMVGILPLTGKRPI